MNAIAHILLAILPLLFAAKTGAFLVMSAIMARQDSRTLLGAYLLRFFVSLSLVGVSLTALFSAFVWQFWDEELSWWLALMLPLTVGVAFAAYYGLRVMQLERESDRPP